MNQRERDIESLLYSRPDLLPPLWFSGGGVSRWLARQYSVPSGRIDLLGIAEFSDHKSLVVVELKSGMIDSRAVAQVCRYANDLQHILDAICSRVDGLLTEADSTVHKVLIGESVDRKTYFEAEGGHKCRICADTAALEVHHNTYERLGHERAADLVVLCRACHQLFHDSGELRY